MEHELSKTTLFTVIESRPAFVKKLVDPPEDLVASLVRKNTQVMYYLAREQKTTRVCNSALEGGLQGTSYWGDPSEELIPKDMWVKLDQKLVLKEINNYPKLIEAIPNPTHEMWVAYAGSNTNRYYNFDFGAIPQKHWTDDVILARLKACTGLHHGIPDPVWTKELALKAIDIKTEYLNRLPKKVITKELVLRTYKTGDRIHLDKEHPLPKSVWDAEVAEAVTSNPHNIVFVPDHLITKEMALKVSSHVNITSIPERFQSDREIQVRTFAQSYKPGKDKFPEIGTLQFQLDVVKIAEQDWRGNLAAVEKLAEAGVIRTKNWPKIIEVQPRAIQYREKRDQTEEDITALITNAPVETIDAMADHLNLAKIKKEHTPLLIGVENKALLSLVERKMKGGTKAKVQKAKDTVTVKMPPKEFNQILKDFPLPEEDK
jgi:hypothetical protein